MKIALIKRNINEIQTAGRLCLDLIDLLISKGHSVFLITESLFEYPPDLNLIPLKAAKGPEFWKLYKFYANVKKTLEKYSFDRTFSFEPVQGVDYFREGDGIETEKRKHYIKYNTNVFKRILYYISPLNNLNLYAENKFYFKFPPKKIIVNSTLVKNQILARYPAEEKNIKLIPNYVVLDEINKFKENNSKEELKKKFGIEGETPVFCFIGGNFFKSGLYFLLKSLQKINFEFVLFIIGEGNISSYHNDTKKFKISKNIRFVGKTDRIYQYLLVSDLFILPSIYDSFPSVCLEAAAFGAVVLTTENNGFSEIIKKYKIGMVCGFNDIDEKINFALENIEYFQNNCRTAARLFNKNKILSSYGELFNESS